MGIFGKKKDASGIYGNIVQEVGQLPKVEDVPNATYASDTPVGLLLPVADGVVTDNCDSSGITFWRRGVGRLKSVAVSNPKTVLSLCSWNGVVYVGCTSGCIFAVPESDAEGVPFSQGTPPGKQAAVYSLCAGRHAASFRIFAGLEDGRVLVYNDSGEAIRQAEGHPGSKITQLCFVPELETLFSVSSGTSVVKCWQEVGDGSWTCRRELQTKDGTIAKVVAWDPLSSTLVSGNSLGTLFLWNISDTALFNSSSDIQCKTVPDAHKSSIEAVCVHCGDIISATRKLVKLHDAPNGHFLRSVIRDEGNNIIAVVVGDGVLYTAELVRFPRCTVNIFDLPARTRLQSEPASSAQGSATTSPQITVPNLSFTAPPSMNRSFGRRQISTSTAGDTDQHSPSECPPLMSLPPPGEQSPPSNGHDRNLSVKKEHRTQASLDFDDFFSGRAQELSASVKNTVSGDMYVDPQTGPATPGPVGISPPTDYVLPKKSSSALVKGEKRPPPRIPPPVPGQTMQRTQPASPGFTSGSVGSVSPTSDASATLDSRERCLDQAFNMLGGVAALEMLKTKAVTAQNHSHAQSIQAVIDALNSFSPTRNGRCGSTGLEHFT